jgi:hypothetical protein
LQQAVGHLHQLIRLGGGLGPLTRRRGDSLCALVGRFDRVRQLYLVAQHRLDHQLDEPLAVVEPVVGNAILFALAGLGRLGGGQCGSRWHRAGSSAAGHLQRQQAAAGEGELAATAGRWRRVRRRRGR